MALNIPTTQEIVDSIVTRFESSLGQTIPTFEKAFVRVLASVLGTNYTSLYKFAVERNKQNLALTATTNDLDTIGANYGVTRQSGTPAQIVVSIETSGAGTGQTIPVTTVLVADNSGITYSPIEEFTVDSDPYTFTVEANQVGADTDTVSGDTFTLTVPISGLQTTAEHSSVATAGSDAETDDAYRRRILNEVRTVGGGGNGVDYRTWAEAVDGVARAFVYAGKPTDGRDGTSEPGDRSVFVEANTDIDPDGVAPSSLLTDVRDAINEDPDTGQTRPPLGHTDDTLFVYSIVRTPLYTTVTGLDTPVGQESAVQTAISAQVDDYFRELAPYLEGIDPEIEKNNVITKLSLGRVVQEILTQTGSTATAITFGTSPGGDLTSKTLDQDELVSSGGVTYA